MKKFLKNHKGRNYRFIACTSIPSSTFPRFLIVPQTLQMKLLFSVFYRHEAEPEVNTPPTGTPAHGLGCPAPCPAPQPALCIGLVTGAGEILTPGGTLLVRKITWPSKKQNRKSTFWLGARSSRSHNVCPSVPLVLSSQLSIFVFMAQVSPRLLSVLSLS